VLEMAVVTWTNQIKAVLKTDPEGVLKGGGNPGPMKGVEFWVELDRGRSDGQSAPECKSETKYSATRSSDHPRHRKVSAMPLSRLFGAPSPPCSFVGPSIRAGSIPTKVS